MKLILIETLICLIISALAILAVADQYPNSSEADLVNSGNILNLFSEE
jgi:hypothetical protein